MFLRMTRLQKVYHCKVFHMPFSLSLCPTLYVSVHLLLLNLRCFLQRCIYIIFYDANIFSLSLPKSIYKLFLGTCVWLLWMVYSTMPTLCTKHLLYMKTEEWCYCSKYSWRISLYQFLSDKKHIPITLNDKMVKDTEMEIYGYDFKLLLVWIV